MRLKFALMVTTFVALMAAPPTLAVFPEKVLRVILQRFGPGDVPETLMAPPSEAVEVLLVNVFPSIVTVLVPPPLKLMAPPDPFAVLLMNVQLVTDKLWEALPDETESAPPALVDTLLLKTQLAIAVISPGLPARIAPPLLDEGVPPLSVTPERLNVTLPGKPAAEPA